MKNCPYCGYQNREGLLFCEDCGQGLTTVETTLPTRKLEGTNNQFSAKATWGTASVGQASSIIIHVRDVTDPVQVKLTDRTLIGRSDASSTQQPSVDLTSYGALEKGVSRNHAAIERSDDVLTLVDLGSSNGTFLNGQKLIAHQPRVLRDGDEVRFGKLITHIYFK